MRRIWEAINQEVRTSWHGRWETPDKWLWSRQEDHCTHDETDGTRIKAENGNGKHKRSE